MNIRGIAELKLISPDGVEMPVGGVEENDICWTALRTLFLADNDFPSARDVTSQGNGSTVRWKLFCGTKDIYPTPLNCWCNKTAEVDVDVNTPYWTDAPLITDPDTVTFTASIPGPTTGQGARTVRVIGLRPDFNTGVYSALRANLTILKLSSPCNQPENYTLVVTYRLFLYPATAPYHLRVSNIHYETLRRVLKRSCQAVNSVSVVSSGMYEYSGSTAYDLDVLDTFALAQYGEGGTAREHELSDNGFHAASNGGSPSFYNLRLRHNTMTLPRAYGASEVATLGCFVKYHVLGGGNATTTLGGVNRIVGYNEALPGVTEPLQSVYQQRATPPGPFQDLTAGNTGVSTGAVSFDTSAWVDPLHQKLFRVRIASGGDLITPATYVVDVHSFIAGFAGNRWIPRTAAFPHAMPGNDHHFRKTAYEAAYETNVLFGGTTFRGNSTQYVLAADCSRSKAGFAIYDLLSGKKHVYNNASPVAFTGTAVADGVVAKDYYYIACANTGLWRLSPDRLTMEHIPTPVIDGLEKAYQLCIKHDVANTLWVLFDGGLCKLSNPDAAIGSLSWTVYNPTSGTTFSFTGITDGKWDKVVSMAIDPDNLADDQFLFMTVGPVAVSGSGYRHGFVWWKTSTGGGGTNPSTYGIDLLALAAWNTASLLPISDQLRCSQGRWSLTRCTPSQATPGIYHWVYGANTLNALYYYAKSFSPARAVPVTINGTTGFVTSETPTNVGWNGSCGQFVQASALATITNGSQLTSANAALEFYLREGPISTGGVLEDGYTYYGDLASVLCYLPGCNLFLTYESYIGAYAVTPFMLQPTHAKYATYKDAFWKTYGWDGSAWVLGLGTGRPVHATSETLPALDGAKVSFADGTSPSFITNEWWTSVLGKGLMKDNGTTYNFTLSFNLEPTETVAVSGAIPQTPLGVLVDEPVTFFPDVPTRSENYNAAYSGLSVFAQQKGLLIHHPDNPADYTNFYSDQVIPASTDFDLRFKWISYPTQSSTTLADLKAFGLATAVAYPAFVVYFAYDSSADQLRAYNSAGTVLGSAITNPTHGAECRITRVGTTVRTYFDGVEIGSGITSGVSGSFLVRSRGTQYSYDSGYYDIKLTYTEARRVLRVGNAGVPSGSFSPRFMGLTMYNTGDTRLTLGTGPGLSAVLDYTGAATAISGTGVVKVAPGAGWLIFHDAEPANPVTGVTLAHYLPVGL